MKNNPIYILMFAHGTIEFLYSLDGFCAFASSNMSFFAHIELPPECYYFFHFTSPRLPRLLNPTKILNKAKSTKYIYPATFSSGIILTRTIYTAGTAIKNAGSISSICHAGRGDVLSLFFFCFFFLVEVSLLDDFFKASSKGSLLSNSLN